MAVKSFTCTDCGVKCSTKAKLNAHVKLHAFEERSDIFCKACDKRFSSVSVLKRHVKNCQKYLNIDLDNASKETHGETQDSTCSVQLMSSKVQTLLDASNITNQSSSANDVAIDENRNLEQSGARSIYEMSTKVQNLLDSNAKSCSVAPVCEEGTSRDNTKSPIVRKLSQSSSDKKNSLYKAVTKKVTRKGISRNKAYLKSTSIFATKRAKAEAKKDVQKGRESSLTTKVSPRKKKVSSLSKEASCTENLNGATVQDGKKPENKQGSLKLTKLAIATKKALLKEGKENGEESLDEEREKNANEEISDENEENCNSILVTKSEDNQQASAEVSNTAMGKKFVCSQCCKTFSRKYHLDRHLKLSPCSGQPPQSFPCQVCNRVYSRKDNLREHLRQHTGEPQRVKKHKCSICNKAFHGQSLLTIHMRTHTGEKPFGCDFCSKQFPSAGALSKHRRTHTGERPFECKECGLKFSLKGTLKRHTRVHTGVRPHKCSYCGKQFIQIGGLKAHMFYHTGENGFKCEDCGKVFNRKARLQMHNLYVHVKHRPFVCEHCHKSFTRKEDLNRHNVLHTGEKPFKCPTCSKTFAIKPSLKLHLLTHTKEEPRSCHECGRAFIRKDCLLRHMRKRHRDLLDKILLDEKDEKYGDSNLATSRMLGEEDLCENITELLSLLVEESTLVGFGWPDKPVDEVLEAVIRRCGHCPVSPDQYSYMDRMRENAKLLFTVVIDDNAVKTLLNNQTVDEVILHVLRLAKT